VTAGPAGVDGADARAAAARLTGCQVTSARTLSATLTEVTLGDGRTVMVKRAAEPGAVRAEPPARLHGDLWNGNVLWGTDGQVRLIDPAAHGGHRETDLAMLHLFGCPHLDRVLEGYQQAAPLADGWAGRIALHQLFPLLVHTVLFGGGYAGQAVAAARRAAAR
jgi:fructosamine-3-kinase